MPNGGGTPLWNEHEPRSLWQQVRDLEERNMRLREQNASLKNNLKDLQDKLTALRKTIRLISEDKAKE